MDRFKIHGQVIGDYRDYIESFNHCRQKQPQKRATVGKTAAKFGRQLLPARTKKPTFPPVFQTDFGQKLPALAGTDRVKIPSLYVTATKIQTLKKAFKIEGFMGVFRSFLDLTLLGLANRRIRPLCHLSIPGTEPSDI